MILSGSGHRLGVLKTEQDATFQDTHNRLIRYLKSILPYYKSTKVISEVISGMAIGFDQAFAIAALEENIPVTAAIPFEGQEKIWKPWAKEVYWEILKSAQKINVVCEGGYANYKFHIRDRWMVDNGNALLTLYNGLNVGGTATTVKYAKTMKKDIFNIWEGWKEFE